MVPFAAFGKAAIINNCLTHLASDNMMGGPWRGGEGERRACYVLVCVWEGGGEASQLVSEGSEEMLRGEYQTRFRKNKKVMVQRSSRGNRLISARERSGGERRGRGGILKVRRGWFLEAPSRSTSYTRLVRVRPTERGSGVGSGEGKCIESNLEEPLPFIVGSPSRQTLLCQQQQQHHHHHHHQQHQHQHQQQQPPAHHNSNRPAARTANNTGASSSLASFS